MEGLLLIVNYLCPQMSGSRIRTAGRFKPCVHMGCFDLEAFVELNQRSRKVFVVHVCLYMLIMYFISSSFYFF